MGEPDTVVGQLLAENRALRTELETLRTSAVPHPCGPYVRGDGEAAAYLGMLDPQGRTFRKWAERNALPYSIIGNTRTYRKRDIDQLWLNTAYNLPFGKKV